MAQNPSEKADLRLIGYIAPLYAVAGAKSRIEQSVWLQHFHFWCLPSNGLRRGFSTAKAALCRT
jgi:hypothetical protein